MHVINTSRDICNNMYQNLEITVKTSRVYYRDTGFYDLGRKNWNLGIKLQKCFVLFCMLAIKHIIKRLEFFNRLPKRTKQATLTFLSSNGTFQILTAHLLVSKWDWRSKFDIWVFLFLVGVIIHIEIKVMNSLIV